MLEIKKYDLTLINQDKKWGNYIINGLNKIYSSNKENRKLINWLFNGACGLIKSLAYPGYCSLCTVHREDNDSYQFGSNGVTFEYAPLYNEEGQRILVKYDRDEFFASVISQRHYNVESKKDVYEDYHLSTLVNGTGDMWDKIDK